MQENSYLNGIILAQSWVYQARLRGDEHAEQAYQRILELAIENYKKFQELDEKGNVSS